MLVRMLVLLVLLVLLILIPYPLAAAAVVQARPSR
jgi:hypothetical protein